MSKSLPERELELLNYVEKDKKEGLSRQETVDFFNKYCSFACESANDYPEWLSEFDKSSRRDYLLAWGRLYDVTYQTHKAREAMGLEAGGFPLMEPQRSEAIKMARKERMDKYRNQIIPKAFLRNLDYEAVRSGYPSPVGRYFQ